MREMRVPKRRSHFKLHYIAEGDGVGKPLGYGSCREVGFFLAVPMFNYRELTRDPLKVTCKRCRKRLGL